MNAKAIKFAKDHGKRYTVGSDSHSTFEMGRSNMILKDFSNAQELRSSLKNAEVTFKYSPNWVRLFYRYAYFMNQRKKRN